MPKVLQRGPIDFRAAVIFASVILLPFVFAGCGELEKPKTEEFYSETKPPRSKEFRWTNGQLPKTIDPAKASAPPETDFVRALYEGLTETDPKTLEAIPGVATEWESSDDYKTWTFTLRRDGRWSNGKRIVAKDFVRSWQRLARLGTDVSHHELLKNIAGMRTAAAVIEKENPESKPAAEVVRKEESPETKKSPESSKPVVSPVGTPPKLKLKPSADGSAVAAKDPSAAAREVVSEKALAEISVKATAEFELTVTLIRPDKEFPKLVAHPVFRPVYDDGEAFEKEAVSKEIVTNGAFDIDTIAEDGITLKRSEKYWNRDNVKLERVRFVPTKDADSALLAYREGKVDAVTNAQFEPLALKLLTPFYDFRRVTHSALNLYEFNRQKPPFNDRRVREALAISIERSKLTADEMDGATKPASKYLPFHERATQPLLNYDSKRAKDLMEKAGFENGLDFPTVRLVVNRNNIQQKIARSVAKMWKDELNIETEIIVKETSEMETAKREGDFDVLRSGVVLPTSDETANMLAIFKPTKLEKPAPGKDAGDVPTRPKSESGILEAAKNPLSDPSRNRSEGDSDPNVVSQNGSKGPQGDELVIDVGADVYILTEDEALIEVPGIPLYFPTSYSLVKPYVSGFEMNSLDAPSLKDVVIDTTWQPKSAAKES
ncbi:MAG: peptide ABC transporter substrate-binding protein [Pyrinomonadaceae bacterium]